MSKRFQLKPPVVRTSENDVRKACLDILRLRHWWPIRQHVGLYKTPDGRWIRIGEVGDPDYVAVKPPSFFLETKRPGGELEPEQIKRISDLKTFYGMDTAVVESVEELIDWLDQNRSP